MSQEIPGPRYSAETQQGGVDIGTVFSTTFERMYTENKQARNVHEVVMTEHITTLRALADRVEDMSKKQSTSISRKGKPQFKEPTMFSGKGSDVDSFLNDVLNAIELQRDTLVDERDKCLVFSTYLNPSTKEWFCGIQKNNERLLYDFDKFIEAFRTHFGNTNIIYEYSRKLDKLTQTGACNNYATKFKDYASYLAMTDQTKIDRFYHGLKPCVKDQLANILCRDLPTDFDHYVSLCIEKDDRVHERHVEKEEERKNPGGASSRGTTFSNHSSQAATTPSVSNTLPPGEPMQIDATKTKKPTRPLTEIKKKCCRDAGLCAYCGIVRHFAKDCPNKSEKAKKKDADRSKSTPSKKD